MEFTLFCDNIDTFVGILFNDDHINLNEPTGKLLVYKNLAISFFSKKSNLISKIK